MVNPEGVWNKSYFKSNLPEYFGENKSIWTLNQIWNSLIADTECMCATKGFPLARLKTLKDPDNSASSGTIGETVEADLEEG